MISLKLLKKQLLERGGKMRKYNVFVTRKLPGNAIEMLKKRFIVKVYDKDHAIPRNELINGVKWCDALLCLLTDKIDAEILNLNKNLKIIANYAVGYDNIDVKEATRIGIPITNTPDVLTNAVADLTYSLLVSVARRIPEGDRFVRNGNFKGWKPNLMLGVDLTGKTLGIVGLGRIGKAVAKRSIGFDMKILYYDVNHDKEFEKEFKAKFVNLKELLKKSDFISIHVPLMQSTRHLISKKEFALMKKTAILINTSRGPVVDEKELVNVLRRKRIFGAGLDVYEKEPTLSPGLNKLDNAVIVPHVGSGTIETRSEMAELAAKNIISRLTGKKLLTLVNKDVKYK